MSELMNARNSSREFRRQLLTTVSALALLGAVYGSSESKAAGEDSDRPTIWIELGGQMENVSGQGEVFAPAFLTVNSSSSVMQSPSPQQAQKPPRSFGEEGKISFQPESSDWIFSAAIRIGRSSNSRHVDHQTNGTFHQTYQFGVPKFPGNIYTFADFADTHIHRQESHTVVDFSVGKDVGLGLFGRESSSVISAGVRFAQFTSKSAFEIRARPDLEFKYRTFASFGLPSYGIKLPHFHTYHATGNAPRSFRGVGPSLSWNGSTPFVGDPQVGEVTFDWGANGSILFGKQRTHVRHQETAHYLSALARFSTTRYQLVYHHSGEGHDTARSVIVPNVGGFAGLSYCYSDAKISLGYRADFFFGAIDGGIDARKSETLGFYGPFATISVGLGG